MQADETHEQRCSRTGMAEDEEFLAREELLDLRHFLGRDIGDEIASILFGFALDEDAGGFANASE